MNAYKYTHKKKRLTISIFSPKKALKKRGGGGRRVCVTKKFSTILLYRRKSYQLEWKETQHQVLPICIDLYKFPLSPREIESEKFFFFVKDKKKFYLVLYYAEKKITIKSLKFLKKYSEVSEKRI